MKTLKIETFNQTQNTIYIIVYAMNMVEYNGISQNRKVQDVGKLLEITHEGTIQVADFKVRIMNMKSSK